MQGAASSKGTPAYLDVEIIQARHIPFNEPHKEGKCQVSALHTLLKFVPVTLLNLDTANTDKISEEERNSVMIPNAFCVCTYQDQGNS
jgi:hypothetical protein